MLLTTVGDLWPFDSESVAREVSMLQADRNYEQLASGPLFAFSKALARYCQVGLRGFV